MSPRAPAKTRNAAAPGGGPVVSLRIDLPNGSRLGPGKAALLAAVAAHGSISAAARTQGMSYRRAWMLIDDLNRAFELPVVTTFPGRSVGAGAALTPFGAELVALYGSCEEAAQRAVAAQVAKIAVRLDRSYASARVSRKRPRGPGP